MDNSISINHSGIRFSVEYATELLGVISILCKDQDAICDAGEERCNEEYRIEVLAYFQKWKDSEITRLLEHLSDEYNFNYDAPVELVLLLKHRQPIDLETLCLHRKPVPPALFEHFVNLLIRFESESNFQEFYETHRHYYKCILDRFIADYDIFKPLDFLVRYLGIANDNVFNVNLMLGITNANYGVTVGNHRYANLRPNGKSRFLPMPDYSFSAIYWTTLIVHEFAHSFVNPVTAKFRAQISTIDILPYADILKEMMYGSSLETYINETVIRAIECLYVKQHFPSCYEEYISNYEDEGFCQIREVTRKLNVEERTLEDSIQDIINMF